jgi:hypothetical protein
LKALQILPPVQRSQLDALPHDPRFLLRRDSLYQLLLAPISELGAPVENLEAREHAGVDARDPYNRHPRSNGVGSYGVYGGYGYGYGYGYGGPQARVYGGYQQGAVGVHAGVGLGGPTVGISIGRVFGIGGR